MPSGCGPRSSASWASGGARVPRGVRAPSRGASGVTVLAASLWGSTSGCSSSSRSVLRGRLPRRTMLSAGARAQEARRSSPAGWGAAAGDEERRSTTTASTTRWVPEPLADGSAVRLDDGLQRLAGRAARAPACRCSPASSSRSPCSPRSRGGRCGGLPAQRHLRPGDRRDRRGLVVLLDGAARSRQQARSTTSSPTRCPCSRARFGPATRSCRPSTRSRRRSVSPRPTSSSGGREIRLGRPIDDALSRWRSRIGSDDLKWAVIAINVQRQVGGNLAEVLDIVANTVRERAYIRRQVKVLSAEGRFSVVILRRCRSSCLVLSGDREPGYIKLAVHDRPGLVCSSAVALIPGCSG